jgi:predicted DNA-binding protein
MRTCRPSQLLVRMSPEERQTLLRLAAMSGKTVSDVVRELAAERLRTVEQYAVGYRSESSFPRMR